MSNAPSTDDGAGGIGLARYATWLPRHRLRGAEVAAALGTGPGRGPRVVAGYDEDSTTMGVEAARAALLGWEHPVTAVHLATTSPAVVDKTNATAVHAALGLDARAFAADQAASARGGVAALLAAATGTGLAVLSDVRVGRPGSADESGGADGASAFVWDTADRGVLARLVARAARTEEFLDRWAVPGALGGSQWEERFGADRYLPLVREVAAQALAQAGLEQADHVVLVSPNAAVRKKAAATVLGRLSTAGSPVGHAGCADVGLALAAVLDRAGPGESVLVLSAADGADALLLVTTDLLPARRQGAGVADQLADGLEVPYARYLSWRGVITPDPPRRPEPPVPAAPPSSRSRAWKFALHGSVCERCGFVHLPPARVCKRCGAVDAMAPAPMARRAGTVATFTIDRLAASPSPPQAQAVVDFDGGGRSTFEVADVQVDRLRVGARVEATFRRLFTAGGVPDYFWKVRLLGDSGADAGGADVAGADDAGEAAGDARARAAQAQRVERQAEQQVQQVQREQQQEVPV